MVIHNVSDSSVKNRAIFLIGGYEPKSADAFFKRTEREYARFGDTWKLRTQYKPPRTSNNGHMASVELETGSKDWAVNTEFNFLLWNKLVLEDFARPLPVRFLRYLITFLDYIFSGVLFSFFRLNWRYALYFLYPPVILILFAIISVFISKLVLLLNFPGNFIASAIIAIAIFSTLLVWPGRRWNILHLFDLWSFSRYFAREKRPDALALAETHAKALIEASESEKFDEILLIGHSTGGVMALTIAAAAVTLDPQLAERKAKISILTVGSTALKVGLHPAAAAFRGRVQALVDCPNLDWVEYQSLTDIINFYKTDPVKEMGLVNNRPDEFPMVRQVRMREMLEPKVYARVKRNFFRVHYQFIMANTRPYNYDFFAICCAPAYLKQRYEIGPSVPRTPEEEEMMLIGERA